MTSLGNAMASLKESSGILYVGFLAEDSAPSMQSCSFSNSVSSSSSKIFAQQCQGYYKLLSFGQSRIIIKLICLWTARSTLTDS